MRKTIANITVAALALAPTLALAQPAIPKPLGNLTLTQLIGVVIRGFMGLAGSIALIMFIWGGVTWLLSQGVSAKIDEAKKTMINASLGLIIIFSSYAIVNFVLSKL